MAKNDNMLAILWMLNSGTKITAKQMAEKLEMNIRTVYRYIDALSASGVPIVSDAGHHGGYYLQNQVIRAPLLFDMDEKKALLQAATFAKEAGYPLTDALDTATLKLLKYTNEKQESLLSHQVSGVEVISGASVPCNQWLLTQLEQAVVSETSVIVDYRTGKEAVSKLRTLDLYGVVYWNQRWYCVGFCHLRQEIRRFRVERILSLEHTDLTFTRPKDFSPRDFFMHNLLPTPEGKETLLKVRVTGRAEALDDLCNHWYLGRYLSERMVNEACFTLDKASALTYVPNFLLPYGQALQVIEPQLLKERLVEVASELMSYYKL